MATTGSRSTSAARKKPAAKSAVKKAAPKSGSNVARKAAPAKQAPAKKNTAKKAVTKKTAAKKVPVKKTAVKKTAVKKVPVKKTAAKKTTIKAPTQKKSAPATKPAPATKAAKPSLVVREDESPWTPAEIAEVRTQLLASVDQLEEEIQATESDIAELVADSGDGAGDDQADAGTKTFEREHEMSLANNARAMLMQVHHAIERLDDGSYGICESCGKPIGKRRLQAFPRATMCLACKQADERRYQ